MSIVIQLVSLALVLAWARPAFLWAKRGLHVLQLEEYQTARFGRWLAANAGLAFNGRLIAALALTSLATLVLGTLLPWPIALIAPLASGAVGAWWSFRERLPEAKKPLVLTARAKRLLAGWVVCALVVLALVALAVSPALGARPDGLVVGVAAGLLIVVLLGWPLQLVANLLLYPVEARFRAYYLGDARRILREYGPAVIGVAGSYGKTSTKTILGQILGSKEPTLATPRSFNTPMGLCRVIREQLKPSHRFFIAELGAYQRGEIRDLCKLVRPTIGVLTAVGPEHLERFGSMENVREAEFELIAALPADGLAVFNGYDPTCLELSARAACRKQIVGGPDPDLWAEDVRLSSDGLGFEICARDGRRTAVTSRLLGRHNVANVLAASAVALACGVAFEDLPGLIGRLDPVEHRLQLVPNPNGVVVIDDTYNSNPRGAAAALETLASFAGGRRYLVTPGMVELADLQDEAHRAFGEQAAKVCDRVILIGPRRTRAIADGLAAAGFGQERLIVTRSLAEATDHLKTLLRPGDAVLFENDLPDHYSE